MSDPYLLNLANKNMFKLKKKLINMNGYKCFGSNRQELHKNAKRGSGGMGFLIKNNFVETFEIRLLSESIEST